MYDSTYMRFQSSQIYRQKIACLGLGEGKLLFNGYKVSFGMMGSPEVWDGSDGTAV